MSFLRELWALIRARKILVASGLYCDVSFAGLAVLSQGSAVASFVCTIF